MNSIAILEAVNTSYVPFNGQQIITAMAAGVAYVAMKPIVENLGMSWSTQQTKLMKQISKFNCVHMNMVAADGKLRKLLCLPLKKLNGWLFSINPEKVRADIRDKLIQYQEECFMKWFTEFGHLNRGDMLTSEQHRCHNEKKKFQRRV